MQTKQLACAILFAAFATEHRASAEVITILETNTMDSVSYTTEWTYDLDRANGTAKLQRGRYLADNVKLKNIIVGNDVLFTVTSIADGALADNPALYSCTIPNSILEIGAYAFSNCTALSSVDLGNGVRYIGERAFVNTIITKINLPNTLLDMGGNISAGTLFTEKINIGGSSHFKYSDDGVLYNRDMTKLYACPTRAEGTVTIPGTVTNIAADAFFGCHRLSYLNIPATVNTIGSGAFNVAGIWPGLSAPESTPKLKTIFFNGPPPEAADDIFNGAPPDDLIIYALSDEWKGVSTWKGLPVQVIDSANPPVLSYTDDTTGITWYYRIVNGMAEISNDGKAAISPKSTPGRPFMLTEESQDWSALWVLQIPKSINGYVVTKIGDHAFDGCNNLTRIGIPSSVESIGKYAFKGCYAIKAISDDQGIMLAEDVSLPVGVASLGYHPFEGLKVSSVSLPYTLSAIEGNPVAGCAYVTSLSVDSTCPAFYSDGNILYNKRKNTVIAVPANYDGASVSVLDSVTTIGDEALLGCKNLSKIQVPEALKAIGARSFEGCASIKSLAMPDTLVEIGDAAFLNCSNLTKVAYAGIAPTAADNIYEGTPETLTSYVNKDSGFTTGKWKGRNVVIVSSGDDPGSGDAPGDSELSQTIENLTWHFRVVDNVAEIWRNGTTAVTCADPILSLALPTDLGGYMVKGIGDGALSNLRGITEISVPRTYESIGAYAFSNCTSLATVSIPYGVRYIGERVFVNTVITEIDLPDTLLDMGGNISAGTLFTDKINIGDSSHFVHDANGLLYNSDKTKLYACPTRAEGKLSITNAITSIAKDAFFGCNRLTALEFPATLEAIEDGAFNVAGIWTGLSAPESTAQLKSVMFKGDPPEASDGIFEGAPDDIVVYAETAAWKTISKWKGRKVVISEATPYDLSETIGGITWQYRVKDGNATITGASGEAEIVTVPGMLGGYAVSTVNTNALDSLSGVKAYKSEANIFKTKNGCLYSDDGKTLLRVPDALVLPYSVTTEISSNIVTVTIIPGIKGSDDPGNDGTSITTNTTPIASHPSTKNLPGDISFETLLAGVTNIADHAFYGCNGSLTNESSTVYETLSGETGFLGTGGSPYIRTSSLEVTTTTTYTTTFTIPSTVKTRGDLAFENSGVTVTDNADAHSPPAAQETPAATSLLEENTSYIGWIEKDGRIVGTMTAKTGRKRKGVLQTSGSIIKIGRKKTRIKNESELKSLVGLTLVKDLSKSKSAAEKSVFNRFKGKCWTVALMASGTSEPLLGGYTALSISVQAKGKVRIKGSAADGTKISSSAQMVVDEGTFKIPVAVQLYAKKRGGFATVLVLDDAGNISVEGGELSYTAILGGASVGTSLAQMACAPRGSGLYGNILIWGAAEDGYVLAEKTGWKPRYTKSSGLFKGNVNLLKASNGKRVRATVNGAVVDGIGYGTAVIKNTASWQVEVMPESD